MTEFKVFYSWQSDLPRETNQDAIKACLRVAFNQVELEIDNCSLLLDEATRDMPGSPNIPNTIMAKIDSSDIFVCDLSTINKIDEPNNRRVQNPNVLIELGYAVGILGWERIIILFNSLYGAFPNDLPFDIDRHRAINYTVKDKTDKSGKNSLSKVLSTALNVIIEKQPLKPHEKKLELPETTKRNNDLKNLRLALNHIHIPTFDNFLERIPDTIIDSIFFYQEGFKAIIEANSFHVYDEELNQRLIKFKDNWNKSTSYWMHYQGDGSGRNYRFHLPMDVFPSKKAEEDYLEISKIKIELDTDFKNLLFYVRNHYLEINLDETSKTAHEAYIKEMAN